MADREPSVRRPTLHPENELPDAPHFRPFPPRREPPALIAGRDLEHYWNDTKWPVLVTVVAQAIAFLANQPRSVEWFLAILLSWYLAARVRRMRGDTSYLLSVTGIAGVFAGFGLAVAHLLIARQLFYLFELLSLPAETAIAMMVAGTGPVLLWQRWKAHRPKDRPMPPPPTITPNHG
jgi:hypothetical protein